MEDTPICGIFGFLGKSQDPAASWLIANALMVKTETRGSDATGFWATERGNGKVWYDKEAVKSSIYSERSIWKEGFSKVDADLLLGHCRQCSAGVGNEKCNRNNHPHVSKDKTVALIHNGRIPEYDRLKSRYELFGECDSEILLAMYQTGWQHRGKDDYLADQMPHLMPHLAFRAMGLMEIFKFVNCAAIAMAIGERGDDGERFVWLHRNNERPIHVVDLTDTLGQVFFFSTPEIWRNALSTLPDDVRKKYVPMPKEIGIFPTEELWLLRLHYGENGDPAPLESTKFKIERKKFSEYTDDDDMPVKYRRPEPLVDIEVVSRLNSREEVVLPAVIDTDLTAGVEAVEGPGDERPEVGQTDTGDVDDGGKKKTV